MSQIFIRKYAVSNIFIIMIYLIFGALEAIAYTAPSGSPDVKFRLSFEKKFARCSSNLFYQMGVPIRYESISIESSGIEGGNSLGFQKAQHSKILSSVHSYAKSSFSMVSDGNFSRLAQSQISQFAMEWRLEREKEKFKKDLAREKEKQRRMQDELDNVPFSRRNTIEYKKHQKQLTARMESFDKQMKKQSEEFYNLSENKLGESPAFFFNESYSSCVGDSSKALMSFMFCTEYSNDCSSQIMIAYVDQCSLSNPQLAFNQTQWMLRGLGNMISSTFPFEEVRNDLVFGDFECPTLQDLANYMGHN